MLRIHNTTSVAAAKSYYTESLSKENYYSRDEQVVGLWQGKGAEKIGLGQEVQQQEFDALCENRLPSGDRLTPRDDANRRVGFDFTFSAPKSVTLLYEMTGDERILEQHHAAIRSTMQEIEQDSRVRVRAGGKNEDRVTGNMIWGEFTHFTSRPVDGVTDPHLHTHCFAFNASFDEVEGKWKALELGEVRKDAPYFEAVYDARLAKGLGDLGYAVEKRAWGKTIGWEVKGIEREVIDKFSRRTGEIEKEAEKRGILNDSLKSELGARTRRGKNEHMDRETLRKEWRERLNEDEEQVFAALQKEEVPHKFERSKSPESKEHHQAVTQATRQALDFAVEHKFQHHSAVSEKRFLEAALREGVGTVTPEAVKQELGNRDDLHRRTRQDGRKWVVSKEVLQEEKQMFDFVRDGRGIHKPLGKTDRKIEREFLNEQQRNAIAHVWNSPDRVTAIRGAAGVGKTTLMQEAVSGIEANGKQVFTFAPSSEASRGVLREEGFENAETVQQLLVNQRMQEHVKGAVLWVDEAGLLSSKDMRGLLRVAEQQQARVVLSGDTKQHHAVERGDAFRLLQQEAGLKIVEVEEIQRQSGNYKQAVKHLSTGKIKESFKILEKMGAIHEINDRDTRSKMLLRSYEKAVKAREKVLIVSPTHKEGKSILSDLRASQRHRGILQGQDKLYTTQRNLNLTEAEKNQTIHYQKGRVVQFAKHAKGFKAGEKLLVSGVDEQGQVLVEKNGREEVLNLQERHKYQLFERDSLPVAKGEQIRITHNGFSLPNAKGKRHRFDNGAMHEVTGFTKAGDLKLKNGWVMPSDYGNFTQGYITTSHAAQGKTVDRVLILQASDSLPVASREQFYVSVSRGRKGVEIFTDDKAALKRAVSESDERPSGSEVMRDPAKEQTLFHIRMQELAKAYASYFRDAGSRFQDKISKTKESWKEQFSDKTSPDRAQSDKTSPFREKLEQVRDNWREKIQDRGDDLVPER